MLSGSVGIDAFNIDSARGFGIATYARNLNSGLRALGAKTHLLYGPQRGPPADALLSEISLFDSPPASSRPLIEAASRNFRTLLSPLGRRASGIRINGEVMTQHIARRAPEADARWSSRDLFHAANRAHSAFGCITPLDFKAKDQRAPDIMHWTCPLPLRAPGRPNLYTLHDLVPLRLPFATLDNKNRYLALCRKIGSTADQVVTVSEHSKRDLVRMLGIDEARVSVTYQAVSLPPATLAANATDVAREIESAFGLGWQEYFLFFGAIEPKKNLARVIEAYLSSGVSTPLVIVGGKGWLDDEETRLTYPDLVRITTLHEGTIRSADRVRRYEYLPFGLLANLIRGSKAVLAPFLYEGFGLPVLETMMLGAPVLASTGGSLPEIAGNAAMLVDPYDVGAIRSAIRELDSDADLRTELSDRGLVRARKFSPEAYQARLLDLYRPFIG